MSRQCAPVAMPIQVDKPAAKGSSTRPVVPLPVAEPISADKKEPELEGELLMQIAEVQLFKLQNGTRELLEKGTLQLISTPGEHDGEEVALLILGKFKLALISDLPTLQMDERFFVVPFHTHYVGIFLPSDTTDDERDIFHMLLEEHTEFRQTSMRIDLTHFSEKQDSIVSMSNSIAKGLDSGSQSVATGVLVAAEYAKTGINKSSDWMKTKITPSQGPRSINPAIKSKLQNARLASGVAVKVSKAVVSGALAAASNLSKEVADVVGQTKVGQSIKQPPSSEKTAARVEAAKSLASSALGALVVIYDSMERAALNVFNQVADASVDLTKHKYGDEVGKCAEDGVGILKDVTTASVNMKQAGVKAVAKRVAKGAAVELLEEDEGKKEQRRQQIMTSATTEAAHATSALMLNPQALTALVGVVGNSLVSSSSTHSSLMDVD